LRTLIGLPRSPESVVGYACCRPCPIVAEGLVLKLRRRNFLHIAAGAGQIVFPPPKEALNSARKISR